MVEYQVQLNLGNEYIGSEKSISVNEVVKTVDSNVLAHHIHMHNALIPEQVASSVLENFSVVAAEMMAMGMAIQFKNGQDVVLRIYPDVKVKDGNINLERAKQLDPTVTDLTMENAAALVDKAGVVVRVKAESQSKFTELFKAQKPSLERVAVVQKDKITKDGSIASSENSGSNSGSVAPSTNEGGSNSNDEPGGDDH